MTNKNKYFNINDTLFNITEKYKEAIDLLVSIGFENIEDEKQRQTIGKAITLETALKMKKINVDTFTHQLIEIIETNQENIDKTIDTSKFNKNADVTIEGILPCPVRIPLMEALNDWINMNQNKLDIAIKYELKAASMGVDWLKKSLEELSSEDVLPDIFISAGFDLFFDNKLIGKFKSQNLFEDITGIQHYNKDFENDYMNLKDPDNQYSMLGVVPAVFLVNTEELNGKQMPTSWSDILSKQFENKVSLPVGDMDLFNALLLNIYKIYGEDGVKKLGKSLLKSMHPSEMVKSHVRKTEKPIITIMPYFFTKMIKENGPMKAVWPKDGAILSPIFMLSKKSKSDKLKPIINFFASKEVGEILSHNGKFPSVNPDVDNRISSNNKYMWLGWDFINNNDIGDLIKECENIFDLAVKEAINK